MLSEQDKINRRREYGIKYRSGEKYKTNRKKIRDARTPVQKKKIADRQRQYQKLNKERIGQQQKEWYLKNQDKRLKKLYGISLVEYNFILKKQNNSCAICGRKDRKLCLDHDHTTNKVRGLLCHQCNHAIGLLGENIRSLNKAINYIEYYGNKT